MPFARHEFTVTDENGNIVTSAQVEVRQEIAGAPLAALYSDRDGTVPLGNPFSVDPTTAVAAFHVAGGAYRVRAYVTSTGFERIARYVAIGTASETDAGLIPTSITTGWEFDDATADADPGTGLFRLNNATPASATAVYIDNENAGGNSVTAWLDTLDDSGESADRGKLHICDPDQPTEVFRIYTVTGTVTDGTGYRKLSITHVAGAGSFTAGTLYSVSFYSKGTTGEVPNTRNLTAGAGLTGGGDLSADRSFAVGAGTGITVGADTVGLSDMAAWTLKGRNAGTTGAPSDIAVGDLTEEAAPEDGDFLLGFLASGEMRKIDVANVASGGGLSSIVMQTFTGSGTYTPTSDMVSCIVFATGAGGGADGSAAAGAGGGAGATVIDAFTAASIGASQPVTVGTGVAGGTGGTTSFGNALSITFGSQAGAASSSSVATISGMTLGTAATDRLIAAALTVESDATISTVTIGGQTAVQRASARDTGSSPDQVAEIWVAAVPTGTTGDVVVTLSTGDATVHCSTFRIVGANTTPTDSDSNQGSAATLAITGLTIPTNGSGIACFCNNTDTTAVAWTGASESSDVDAGVHRHSAAIITTVGTNAITADGATANQALCGVAFRPLLYIAAAGGSSSTTSTPGAGATASSGSIAIDGGDGGWIGSVGSPVGSGGASFWGGGGSLHSGGQSLGAKAYGSGSAGGPVDASDSPGKAGVVLVLEFIS